MLSLADELSISIAMTTEHSHQRSVELARAVVAELGGSSKAAKLVGISQPSVSLWSRRGLGVVRENDLRFRFPDLKVWKKFPPVGVEAR